MGAEHLAPSSCASGSLDRRITESVHVEFAASTAEGSQSQRQFRQICVSQLVAIKRVPGSVS